MTVEMMRKELIKRVPEMECEINTASEDAIIVCVGVLKLSKEDRELFIEHLDAKRKGRNN